MSSPMLQTRVPNAHFARIAAAAAKLGVTGAELVRELIDAHLPSIEDRTRDAAPPLHGVTESQAAEAATRLAIEINTSDAIRLTGGDLYGPRGRAARELLDAIWGGAGDSPEVLAAFARPATPPAAESSERTRPYPRKKPRGA